MMNNKPSRVYLVLLLLTLLTYLVGENGLGGLWVAAVVMLVAVLKGVLVVQYFMGFRQVIGWWRWPVLVWLFLPTALIMLSFYLAAI